MYRPARPIARLLCIALGALTPLVGRADEPSKAPIVKVGVIAPLTLGNAKMGEDVRRAAELALALKAPGPVQYELVVEDGKCGSGNAASTALSKLLAVDRIGALIIGCSGEILQTAQSVEQHALPTMVVYASHPQVKHLGPHIFRVFVDSERDIPIIARRIVADGRFRLAVLTEELAFTVGVRDVLRKELGVRITADLDFREGEQDFRGLLLKVKSSAPDAIFLNAGSAETLGPLAKQVAELGIDVPMYSFAYASLPAFLEGYGRYAEGMIFVGPPDVENPAFREMTARHKERFGSNPNVPFVAATTFDGATALFSAMDRSNGAGAGAAVKALETYSAPGILGTISFDQNGDVQGVHYVLRRIHEAKLVAVD